MDPVYGSGVRAGAVTTAVTTAVNAARQISTGAVTAAYRSSELSARSALPRAPVSDVVQLTGVRSQSRSGAALSRPSSAEVYLRAEYIAREASKVNTDVSMEYNKHIDAVIITVKKYGIVIRTIPSASYVRMQLALNDMIGNFLNKTA